MDQRLPSLLLAAILAALLWFGIVGVAPAPPPVDASIGRASEAQLAELVRRIEGIEHRLDRSDPSGPVSFPSPSTGASAAADVVGRRAAGASKDDVTAIRGELAKLWQALDARGAGNGAIAPGAMNGSVAPSVIRAARPDYVAIAAFLDLIEQNSEAAKQEILMADQTEILRRFGRPAGIDADGPSRRSWYFHDEEDRRGFEISFVDGYVTDL